MMPIDEQRAAARCPSRSSNATRLLVALLVVVAGCTSRDDGASSANVDDTSVETADTADDSGDTVPEAEPDRLGTDVRYAGLAATCESDGVAECDLLRAAENLAYAVYGSSCGGRIDPTPKLCSELFGTEFADASGAPGRAGASELEITVAADCADDKLGSCDGLRASAHPELVLYGQTCGGRIVATESACEVLYGAAEPPEPGPARRPPGPSATGVACATDDLSACDTLRTSAVADEVTYGATCGGRVAATSATCVGLLVGPRGVATPAPGAPPTLDATDCQAGKLTACDELRTSTNPDEHNYANTCGGRLAVNVASCTNTFGADQVPDAATPPDIPPTEPSTDATDCEAGKLTACDELRTSANPDELNYANTCGGRLIVAVASCTETFGASDVPRPADSAMIGTDPKLDALVVECRAGTVASCDRLRADSPPGTGYADVGRTCGGSRRASDELCEAAGGSSSDTTTDEDADQETSPPTNPTAPLTDPPVVTTVASTTTEATTTTAAPNTTAAPVPTATDPPPATTNSSSIPTPTNPPDTTTTTIPPPPELRAAVAAIEAGKTTLTWPRQKVYVDESVTHEAVVDTSGLDASANYSVAVIVSGDGITSELTPYKAVLDGEVPFDVPVDVRRAGTLVADLQVLVKTLADVGPAPADVAVDATVEAGEKPQSIFPWLEFLVAAIAGVGGLAVAIIQLRRAHEPKSKPAARTGDAEQSDRD